MNKQAYVEKLRELARSNEETASDSGSELNIGYHDGRADALDDIAQELEAMDVAWVKNKPLPCSVMLPPATVVSRGVALGTLLQAIDMRDGNPMSHIHFDSDSAKELRAMLNVAENTSDA